MSDIDPRQAAATSRFTQRVTTPKPATTTDQSKQQARIQAQVDAKNRIAPRGTGSRKLVGQLPRTPQGFLDLQLSGGFGKIVSVNTTSKTCVVNINGAPLTMSYLQPWTPVVGQKTLVFGTSIGQYLAAGFIG